MIMLQGFGFPSSQASLFDDDEKRWDYLFKTLKKINLRLSDLETKDMQALKQAQGQMYSQLEEIQRILPSLQGIMEVNKSDIDNKISSLLTKTEEIQILSVNQEQRMQGDLAAMKTELERILQTINESLDSQKIGIINEFGLIKEGIAADIKTLADSNSQNFNNFSNATTQSFNRIVENLNVQNENIATTNKTLKEFSKKKIKVDFIFIDGGHDYKTVKNDLEQSFKMISKNGTILCDDWNLSQALGVREAIKDFSKEKNINFEIVHERFAQFNLQ